MAAEQREGTEVIPYIWLQEGEERGEGNCGCVLTYDDQGSAQWFVCPMHRAADDMLAALERIASDQTVFELDEEGEGWDVESLASWHEANVYAARAAIAKAKGE